MFDDGLAIDRVGEMRTSYGYLLQALYQAKSSKWKFGASYGTNHLNQTSNDKSTVVPPPTLKDQMSIVASATYMYTKSLRGVIEYTYGNGKGYNGSETKSSGVAARPDAVLLGITVPRST